MIMEGLRQHHPMKSRPTGPRPLPRPGALALVLAIATWLAPEGGAATVRISAAASLAPVLQAIAPSYEKQTGDHLVFNFAGSGLLARQIEEGAPADVFFSADEARMDALESKGLVVKETRRSRLSNTLVIVVPADSASTAVKGPSDLALPAVRRLALADPGTVPAGNYAREYLQGLKLWDRVRDKVIPFDTVRSALAAVESANADAGIVYATDASSSRRVRVAFAVAGSEGPKIRYPMALLRDAREPAAARRWLAHLESAEAATAFQRAGFTVISSGLAPAGARPATP
jgi:molybdate transport system substrate-binding protein